MGREMPGLKDYVSVKKADGSHESQHKFLVLCNLKEEFQKFKGEHPTVKMGDSKFAELQPKECMLAGVGGTHSVCVCSTHQNVKFRMEAIKTVFKQDVTEFYIDEPGTSTSTWDDGHDFAPLLHYYTDVPPVTSSIKNSPAPAATVTSLTRRDFKQHTDEEYQPSVILKRTAHENSTLFRKMPARKASAAKRKADPANCELDDVKAKPAKKSKSSGSAGEKTLTKVVLEHCKS